MGLRTLQPRVNSVARAMPVATHDRIRGRRLQRIRADHLRDHPLCVKCRGASRTTLAAIVDHIVALENGGTDTPGNRQSLCKACHDAKTKVDNAIARGAA